MYQARARKQLLELSVANAEENYTDLMLTHNTVLQEMCWKLMIDGHNQPNALSYDSGRVVK